MAAHVIQRVSGKLASYGCATIAEVDAHLTALYIRAQVESKDTKRAAWHDINQLLDARLTMTKEQQWTSAA